MVVGSQAFCCAVDPKMLVERLVLAAAFGSAGTSILGRIRFHGRGWQWALVSVASGALAALIWGATFFLLRIAGLSDQSVAVVAYILSIFSLGMTALTKYDEIEDAEQAKSEG